MNDLISSELKDTKNSIESATIEKTMEYDTDEGTIKEKASVTYKVDKGNAIDNAVNTLTESKSVQKAAGFFNQVIRLGATGFGGLFAGAGSYALSQEMFRKRVSTGPEFYNYDYIWTIPETQCIAGSVVVGLFVAIIIFVLYTKWFVK